MLVCFVDMHLFVLSIFAFLSRTLVCNMCVCECMWEREREREWVHIMNNTWCGFLVSETDRRWGWWAAPRVLFFPPHTVVKQTTSAEGSPISTLLLLYCHRQDLSPSIRNAGTGWTAWPLWTTPIPEICNTFCPHMVANSSNGKQKCNFSIWIIGPRWDFWFRLSSDSKMNPHWQIKIFEIVNHDLPPNNHRCALICAFILMLMQTRAQRKKKSKS